MLRFNFMFISQLQLNKVSYRGLLQIHRKCSSSEQYSLSLSLSLSMGISGRRSGWDLILASLVICLSTETCDAKDDSTKSCTSFCGNIHNISYPFRLKDDPKHCGDVRYTLLCENNITLLDLPSSGKFYVQAINYHNHTIRLLDPGLQNNNCSSMPRNSPPVVTELYDMYLYNESLPIFYIKCLNPMNRSLYVDTAPCLNSTSATSLIQSKTYSYVNRGPVEVGDLEEGCSVEWMVYAVLSYSNYYNASYEDIHSALMYGFQLGVRPYQRCKGQWITTDSDKCIPRDIRGFFIFAWYNIYDYFANRHADGFRFGNGGLLQNTYIGREWAPLIYIGLVFAARLILGAPIVTAFFIYKWRRRHLSMYSTIEDFLQCDNNFMPIRYSYSDIKRMTSRFKDKLGEGGYGSVYKGKLRSGRFVAIKVLGKPKANGQDFISEISTIGRIHHVNVVQLIGYCVEGSKRALVYDFMPNGSLDKYVYYKEGSIPLSCKQMHEISLGVAQGIEYLHQGCEMQILHFDIKPHNVLLDENFNAKIADFGLAKLYPVDNSIVSLTAARGTMGYIAPELFYKNIGGVSYKADVYSFGMLLMEMASRRKNLLATVEHSSQIYFPLWVYDQYNEGNDLEMDNVTEEEKKVIRKMVITALWCIQMKPSDRPSMKKVIEMLGLDGDDECLQMPLRPSLCPQEMPAGDNQVSLNPVRSNVELTCTLSAR